MRDDDAIRIRHMLDALIHGYFDIDTTIVWKTVALELPPLEHALEKVLR
jgi:uncharacterized protein with HEPN domain